MKIMIALLTLLFILSCGRVEDESDLNNNNDSQSDPSSPMAIAMKSPSCTLSLGKYGMPLVTACASGYYYENGVKSYATEEDCLEGSTLIGDNDFGLDVIDSKFSQKGCKNYGNTMVRCYINDSRGNIYTLTTSNMPVSPQLMDRIKEACESNGGEFKTIKLNDM